MAQRGRETFDHASLEDWDYLCSGGFGVVYKAKHKDLGINMIIKLLDTDDGSGSLYAALCREADYMAAADHQYVPRVYGMYEGPVPGLGSTVRHGIVMELMEGGSLQSVLRTLSKTQSKTPPWPLAFRLAHQVALAMDYLHDKKDLVHMDLKPGNVLLDANFNAKIADFGLTTLSNSFKPTDGENKGGTPAYTPPEAFGNEYHRVRSYDVYSYGILLWTILTGESPYPGVDHAALAFRIPKGDRPDLRKIDVQKAAGLKDLVNLMKRCWHTKPKKRPSFGECVEVTRRVFSRHEEGIDAAVSAVSDISKQLELEGTGSGSDSDSEGHEEGIDTAVFDISKQLSKETKPEDPEVPENPKVPEDPKDPEDPKVPEDPKDPEDPEDPKELEEMLPPVPEGCTDREVFLRHASPLSLDPNTVNRLLILSEDNMKVTATRQVQGYPEHPERFTRHLSVLSRESLSARSYFEVEWSGEKVVIAVSYKDINRKEKDLSDFGLNDKSWRLRCGGPDGAKRYAFFHNSIGTAVSGPASSTGRNRFGVFVDHLEGVLRFFSVDVGRNTMRLLHTEGTTFTQPLYAGINTAYTVEVCKIW